MGSIVGCPRVISRVICLLGPAALLAGSARAAGLRAEFEGEIHHAEVAGEGSYAWLRPDQMITLTVTGPGPVGLRVRQVREAGRDPLPVDLTVVRDDQEQGTVRFRTPPPDGASFAGPGELSGTLVVRLDVPAGPHRYRLLVSGSAAGILLQPWRGDLGLASVVATPGKAEVLPPRPPPRPRPGPRAPPPEPPDELAGFTVAGAEPADTRIRRILHRPSQPHPPPPHGHGFWIASSLAFVLLGGGTACMAAGGLSEAAAEDEPVQIAAHEHQMHADQAYLSGGVLYGLAGTAALLALVFYLVDEEPAAPPPGGAVGVVVRF